MAPANSTITRVTTVTVRLLPKYNSKFDLSRTLLKPIRLKVSSVGNAIGSRKIALRLFNELITTKKIGHKAISV